MLSVIQPSSNLGAFPSHSYLSAGETSGYAHQSSGNHPYNSYYDKKWSSSWGPSATASYLFQSPYNNNVDFHRVPSSSGMTANRVDTPNSHSYLGYPSRPRVSAPSVSASPCTKDYSKPLFVDCSIEYELPNAPKVPKNSEPILMIHPAYRKRSKRPPSATKQQQQPAPKVINSTPSGDGNVSRGSKRSYSQMSSQYDIMSSNADLYIQQQLLAQPSYPSVSRSSSSSASFPYPCYDPSPKRCCRSAPNDLATFRRQQHLMHLQAQFSLYFRHGGAFWT